MKVLKVKVIRIILLIQINYKFLKSFYDNLLIFIVLFDIFDFYCSFFILKSNISFFDLQELLHEQF